ncbi:unnamed protein product [Linum tenue]|uniref:Aminotransferase class I/classII large domain-containing protein n=1 Tax=Linum tenue TaxID=586396 RepID=A0AAV0HJA7_9ROSI|nr:unnamed protein product [Linum tenue]
MRGSDEEERKRWRFHGNRPEIGEASASTLRGVYNRVMDSMNKEDPRPVIQLGQGDPSAFSCFRTDPSVESAIVGALESGQAVAEYLNSGLPYKLSPDDVYLTVGCTQAIEVAITALACRPGANILLPRPGYPDYESAAAQRHVEVRHYDLQPEKGWAVDLKSLGDLADGNTVAIAVINPGNPCGNVFGYEQLKGIAEVARKLGVLVIADEVYEQLTFGGEKRPFVPMGVFGSIVPVLTLGSLSKRWVVPGWRLGWIAVTDPNAVLRDFGMVDTIKDCINICADPATLIQGAVPQILEKTDRHFYSNINKLLKRAADLCYDRFQDIPGLTCPTRADGAMSLMVKLNLSEFARIEDDIDFCLKLSEEELVILIPGTAVGLKSWVRVTFAIDPWALGIGLDRIKAFCQRHASKYNAISRLSLYPQLNGIA